MLTTRRCPVLGTAAPPGRCLVTGVLEVPAGRPTDGSPAPSAAVARGLTLSADGADVVSVGVEPMRPGVARLPVGEERRLLLPVVDRLVRAGVVVGVDTTRSDVAEAAIQAGAVLVHDVSGGTDGGRMAGVIAGSGVGWVLGHARTPGPDARPRIRAHDVVDAVVEGLSHGADEAVTAGVDPGQLVLDAGLGRTGHAADDWLLLAHLDQLVALGFPVLVSSGHAGLSGGRREADGDPGLLGRGVTTLATTVLAATAGAWGVRVHDVAPAVDAVHLVAAVDSARRVWPTDG